MTIKDYYDTLLRRGMPKHERLRVSHYDHFEQGKGWIQDPILVLGDWRITDSDTRDLLTMHALRWMESMGDSYGVPFRCADIIGAILAATAHLEPKNAD